MNTLRKLLNPKRRKFINQLTNYQLFKKDPLPQSWLPTFYNVCVLTATCVLTAPPSLDLKSRYRNQWLNKVCKQGTIQAIFITYIKQDQVLLKQMPHTILFFSLHVFYTHTWFGNSVIPLFFFILFMLSLSHVPHISKWPLGAGAISVRREGKKGQYLLVLAYSGHRGLVSTV